MRGNRRCWSGSRSSPAEPGARAWAMSTSRFRLLRFGRSHRSSSIVGTPDSVKLGAVIRRESVGGPPTTLGRRSAFSRQWQQCAYSVEKVADRLEGDVAEEKAKALNSPFLRLNQVFRPGFEVNRWGFASSGRSCALSWWTLRHPHRQTTQVLHRRSHRELVHRATKSSQAQAIHPQDSLQVGKQHFHFLALAT